MQRNEIANSFLYHKDQNKWIIIPKANHCSPMGEKGSMVGRISEKGKF